MNGEETSLGSTVNAEWFGVPQERIRYIIVGVRKDIYNRNNMVIKMPKAPKGLKATTVEEAIYDLIPIPASTKLGKDIVPYNTDDHISEYANEMRKGSPGIRNHITAKSTDLALDRFKIIEQGKNFHSLESAYKSTFSKPERTQKRNKVSMSE